MTGPVIIVGAGRSGTNALRDALCVDDAFHTWPCDEINYIWRSGNRTFPTDELLPVHARPEVVAKITAAFERRARHAPDARLVEKTCANSLRVAFVATVFPDAQFVHLVRDGRSVAASAVQRWHAPIDLPYLARKARFVPPLDLPHYALGYVKNRIRRSGSDDDRLAWWGPRFAGMEAFDASTPLVEVAAHQWLACVQSARAQLGELPARQVHTLDYRDLVTQPQQALGELFAFLDVTPTPRHLQMAVASLHQGSLDSWRQTLSAEQQEAVGAITSDLNAEFGLDQ